MVQDGRGSSAAGIRSGDQPGDGDFRRVWRVVVIGRHAVVVVGWQVIVVVSGLRAPLAVRQADRWLRNHARLHNAEGAEPRHDDVTAFGVPANIADISRQPIDFKRVTGDRACQAVLAHHGRNARRIASPLRH